MQFVGGKDSFNWGEGGGLVVFRGKWQIFKLELGLEKLDSSNLL